MASPAVWDGGLQLKADVMDYLKTTYCNAQAISHDGLAACDAHFTSQLEWMTRPPMFSILRVNKLHPEETSVEKMVAKSLAEQGKLRNRTPLQVNYLPEFPDVLMIPHTGPHKRSKHDKEVIVGYGCGMSVLRGADVFVPGIMAASTNVLAGDKVSVYVDVEGKCLRGLIKPFTGTRLFLGNGVAQFSRDDIFRTTQNLSGIGILMTEPIIDAPSLTALLPDLVFAQNLPSILCGHLLGPLPGERVLDMCAAPGGKTTHIATLMANQGQVIALDKSRNKLPKIEQNSSNWGLTSIQVYEYDATKILDESAEPTGSPPYPSASFDRVLLDAPCSALGQRPALVNKIQLAEICSFPVLQRKLIHKAFHLLRPGGTLVYSTCTITLEENEQQVKWALDAFSEMELQTLEAVIGSDGLPGAGLTDEQLSRVRRFGCVSDLGHADPLTDTIGFFCAKFIKLK